MALGELRRRAEILLLLSRMPQSPVASHQEMLAFIEGRGLRGRGIGYVDAHLLASAFLSWGLPSGLTTSVCTRSRTPLASPEAHWVGNHSRR